MPIRVRQKGDRRRASGSTLVRTRPVPRRVPPIPLPSYLYRMMVPAVVADTEDISDTDWSTGTIGTSGVDWNSLYFHVQTPNSRDTTVTGILQPIEWTIDAPASSGGAYDYWVQQPNSTRCTVQSGFSGRVVPYPKLLHSSSHAAPHDGFLQSYHIPPYPIRTTLSSPVVWLESTLYNIAPTIARHGNANVRIRAHAIQHFVNGSAVRAVEYPALFSDPAWRFFCAKGDAYKLRVWYQYSLLASVSAPSAPARYAWYFPLTKTSNGSKRQWGTTLETGGFAMRFANVDYSPNFNNVLQTYNITVAGQLGWTLKDGTNGPHKIATADGWTRTWNNTGRIRWTAPASHPFLYVIDLLYGEEYCRIQLRYKIGGPFGEAIAEYRPSNDSTYHTSSVATDVGTVYHAPSGVFNQAGSTTFSPVEWITEDNPFQQFDDGNTDLFAVINTALPTSITLTRTTL